MLWACSRDGRSGTLQGHWHWVDCRRAAFVRFWVADRMDSLSVLAFGAKWKSANGSQFDADVARWRRSGACARPAGFDWCAARRWFGLISCIRMHRLGECHGTPTLWHSLHGYRRPVKRCEQPDRPVVTRKRGRGRTGRLEGLLASLTPGSAHCTGKPRARGGHRAD